MASEIAQQIVDQIFGDEKSKAIDSVNDALAAAAVMQFKQERLSLPKIYGI